MAHQEETPFLAARLEHTTAMSQSVIAPSPAITYLAQLPRRPGLPEVPLPYAMQSALKCRIPCSTEIMLQVHQV